MATKRENFTAGRIEGFACPAGKGQAFHWDAKARGLGVRVTAAGAKAFIFESSIGGKTLRLTIGDVRAWALGDARAEASRLRVLVDQGIDPRQQKAEKLAEVQAAREETRRAEAPALEAWNAYLDDRRPKWGERSYADHISVSREGGQPVTRGRKFGHGNKLLPGALRPLLSRPLAQLDAVAVRMWLKDEAARRPTHAALAFRLLRGFINWSASRPEFAGQTNADACSSRLVRDELPKKVAKDDCLQREQLRAWFEHVRALQNPVQAAYLQALLLTGARREELAGLRWVDVDFQWRSLAIHDKMEGGRTIPLTPYVGVLLGALPRRNEFVFCSPAAKSGRLQEPRFGHNRALAAAGLPDLSLHGLRRSFGTLAEWVECPVGIVAQIMGHKPSAIAEKHYRRRPLDLLRAWHTKIETWVLEQAGIEPPAEGSARGLRVVV